MGIPEEAGCGHKCGLGQNQRSRRQNNHQVKESFYFNLIIIHLGVLKSSCLLLKCLLKNIKIRIK